ncbi:MAG: hypothetical protein FWE57_10180 [Chitinispirillia bacterium]|nr:hypothetical protein [Chitinispirillia bacterium]
MKVYICACQYYHRIPEDKIAAIQTACREAQIPCEIVPDLCLTSVNNHSKLTELASDDVIMACQHRAVRSLFGNVEELNIEGLNCIDLRAASLDDIMASLSLKPIQPVEELIYEKINCEWIPWFPVIDKTRCTECKKCVDFCIFGVYSIEAGKVKVTQPKSCKTDCPACARICPQNAIIFPKSEEERLNGTLNEKIKPQESDNISLRERLRHRKNNLRLFKEDK